MRKSGFTLVEFLIGLIILSLIASGLYGVFYGAFRFDFAARKLHESSRDLRLGLDMLSRELENALPYPQIVDGQTVAFEGEPERVMFYLDKPSGLERVEYFSGDMARTYTTEVRYWDSVRQTSLNASKEKAEVYLLRRCQALPDFWQKRPDSVEVMAVSGGLAGKGAEFCFGRIDSTGRVTFRERWKGETLPDVVRVRLFPAVSGNPVVTLDIFPVVKKIDLQGQL